MRDVVIGRPSAEFFQWCVFPAINVNSRFPMLRTQLEASCATQQIEVASGEKATSFQRLHERLCQPPSPAAPVSPTLRPRHAAEPSPQRLKPRCHSHGCPLQRERPTAIRRWRTRQSMRARHPQRPHEWPHHRKPAVRQSQSTTARIKRRRSKLGRRNRCHSTVRE